MRATRQSVTTVLWLLILLTWQASAAESPIVVYAESSALDSQLVLDAGGATVKGYASDLVRQLLLESGLVADIQVVPWPRLVAALETQNNVLGYNMTRTAEREDRFHWIGEIRPVRFQLWGLKERRDELPTTLDQAREFKISSYRNDVVEQYLLSRDFDNLVYVSENYDNLRMLRRRRFDLLPFSQIAMQEFMARSSKARSELVPIMELDEISTSHYLVMSKNSDPELVELLKREFQKLVVSGMRDQILGPSASPPPW